jgi:hypothetical protein
VIADLRHGLAGDLATAGVSVHEAWPDRPVPPALVVVPGGPYVAAGQTFGDYLIRVDVLALVARRAYAQSLTELDVLVEAVLSATTSWGLTGVEQPSVVTVGPAEILGAVISLQKAARL